MDLFLRNIIFSITMVSLKNFYDFPYFLKEYDQKDYLSFKKKGAGETNISQQIL